MVQPVLDQLDLIVRDMEVTLAFYRALGLDIPEDDVWRTASGAHHVEVHMPGGFELAFDSHAMAGVYDRGWREPVGRDTRCVLSFKVPTREDVDLLHQKLTALGHPSAQPPFDAFWGARYAIVEDPDGHHVGLMSPVDPACRSAPPEI